MIAFPNRFARRLLNFCPALGFLGALCLGALGALALSDSRSFAETEQSATPQSAVQQSAAQQSAAQGNLSEAAPDFNPFWLFPASLPLAQEARRASLPTSFWEGQETEDITPLLQRLRFSFDSPALLLIAQNMLFSPWPDTFESRRIRHTLRLQKFYDFGSLALLERGLELVPAILSDPRLGETRVRALFARGQPRAACALFRALEPSDEVSYNPAPEAPESLNSDFPLIATTICQFVEGRVELAKMTADLMREQGRGDLFSLLEDAPEKIADSEKTYFDKAHFESPFLALYRASERTLSPALAKRAAPAILLEIFKDRQLAYETRLIAGARAFMRGLISLEELTALYRQRFGRTPSAQNPESLVIHLSRVFAECARIAPAVYLSTFAVYQTSLQSIPVQDHLGHFLPFALQAFLLFNEPDQLRAWLNLTPSTRGRGRTPTDRFVIYFWDRYNDSVNFSESQFSESQFSESTTLSPSRPILRVALHILAPNIISLSSSDRGESVRLQRLANAAENERKGETLLRALDLIHEKGPVHTSPRLLAEALKSLQRVGFGSVARQIAVEIVLTHNLS